MGKKKSFAALAGAILRLAAARFVDLALIAATIAVAVAAVAFAAYMTWSQRREPLINGLQYLAIFAQPSRSGRAEPGAKLDMAPLGAIGREAKESVAGYALVGAQPRFAWLREGNRIFAVRPGDDVPRLGHVAAIESRDGRWALTDENGATLIVGSISELAPTQGARFSKRLIFGDDPRR